MAPAKVPTDDVECADWIREIFSTSYDCMWSEAALLATLALDGAVEVYSTAYDPVPVPEKEDREAYFRFGDANYGGGYGHSLLKWNAYHLLKALGSPAPRYEQEWYHGRADVSCEALQVAVECGSTNPLNILRCLSVPAAREIWLLPFGDRPAYRFRRGAAYNAKTMDHFDWRMHHARLNFPEVFA